MPLLPRLIAMAVLPGALAACPVLAQSRQRVAFVHGNGHASVSGSITGHQYRDHLVGARAGQTMAVSMTQKGRTAVYFNILPPNSTGEAIYNSSMSGDDATGIKLPRNGDYRVRVYLMGAAEGGKRPTPYSLSITVM